MARLAVSPGESMPAAWTNPGTRESWAIKKSAKRSAGGCSLARMPDPLRRRSASVIDGSKAEVKPAGAVPVNGNKLDYALPPLSAVLFVLDKG